MRASVTAMAVLAVLWASFTVTPAPALGQEGAPNRRNVEAALTEIEGLLKELKPTYEVYRDYAVLSSRISLTPEGSLVYYQKVQSPRGDRVFEWKQEAPVAALDPDHVELKKSIGELHQLVLWCVKEGETYPSSVRAETRDDDGAPWQPKFNAKYIKIHFGAGAEHGEKLRIALSRLVEAAQSKVKR
ncbi:hypothetical protein ACFL59_11295 [Planctomycetota bacterium]